MKHTFVICAYRDSQYIEECIRSLKKQTMKSEIVMSTSTPSKYLERLCECHGIEYFVREGQPGIGEDWNYALSVAKTPYVTIAHQDDLYEPEYAQKVMEKALESTQNDKETMILFTDYSELVGTDKYFNRKNIKIKKLLLSPLKATKRQNQKFWKRCVLRFGNAICCPSVTYNMGYIQKVMKEHNCQSLFLGHFRSNLDWQAWEWLSCKEGQFVYIPEVLMAHRIHEESETSATIQGKLRRQEDYEMFCRFWPSWAARMLTGVYKESEKGNQL
ncbi:MAG: glycosyltransferase family 2 protein [Clostridium sp.]|nr:glycosyltransferase family 2 protein [Clostridium sp.]